MSAAVQARRELAEEKMAAIAEAKRLAEVNANGSNRLATLNDRGPRTTSMSSKYKNAETAKASVPSGSLKGGAVDGSTPGSTNCDKRLSRQSWVSSASIEEEEENVGESKAGVRGASLQSGTAGSNTPGDKSCDKQQSSATSAPVKAREGGEEEWQRACDQTTGKKYFWNLRTNEVRWFTAEEEGEAKQGEEDGWERVLDQTTGKEYFWHNVTDEVRWTEPPELTARRAATE